MNLPETKGKCPHCGNEIFNYIEREWKYGSPIQTCKKCKKDYMDKRYHEIAIEGIAPDAMSVKRDTTCIGLGVLFIVVSFLLNLSSMKLNGTYSLRMVSIGIIGLIIIVFMIIDIIRIKTGLKDKRFEKLRAESVKRLQNKSYACKLSDAGYHVPEEYM